MSGARTDQMPVWNEGREDGSSGERERIKNQLGSRTVTGDNPETWNVMSLLLPGRRRGPCSN